MTTPKVTSEALSLHTTMSRGLCQDMIGHASLLIACSALPQSLTDVLEQYNDLQRWRGCATHTVKLANGPIGMGDYDLGDSSCQGQQRSKRASTWMSQCPKGSVLRYLSYRLGSWPVMNMSNMFEKWWPGGSNNHD